MSAVPPFEEAKRRLASFLASQGHPTQLTWVFREDVHWLPRPHGRTLVEAGQRAPPLVAVRLPLPGANPQAAKRLFDRARDGGLGVQLFALCRIGPQVACYVWAPRDEDEGREALLPPGELKLSIRDPLEEAVTRQSRAAWALSTLRSRLQSRESPRQEIPSRKEVDEPALTQGAQASSPDTPSRTE